MAREKKRPEPEQEAGAPEWMVTFSDCMTLLLTFFVLLLSFSSFDDTGGDFKKMSSSFSEQFSISSQKSSDTDAFSTLPIVSQDIHWGSEKPTLDNGLKDRFKKQTDPVDFLKFKTFLISSSEIFWGEGDVISLNGKKVLTDLSLFLKEFPGYFIIVSESGPQDIKTPQDIGFDRAWAVFNYLATKKELGQRKIGISTAGTAVKEYYSSKKRKKNDRMLEIALLRRST